ncbi:MAG: protein phosphatase 2C domain-containing protein [Caldilineaceae bacterium]|nr:protein phosphatase 2C domain-containing protein [Caldilineaceae bacterium]
MEHVNIVGVTPAIAGETNEGARGKKNEDRYAFFQAFGSYGQPIAVMVVADGVTSTSGGAQASEIAATRIEQYLKTPSSRSLLERMTDAVRQANHDIVAVAEENPDWKGMSTTIVLSAIENDSLYTVHLGDSRAYLLRGDQIHQLTVDHTWVQDAIDAGRLQPEDAANHPNRHVIQRFMGLQRGVTVDQSMIKPGDQDALGDERSTTSSIALEPDDAVLLCSDGLYNRMRREELLEIARRWPGQPQAAVHQMIEQAVRRQEPDNITAVMLTTQAAPAMAGLARGRSGLLMAVAGGLAALALIALIWLRPWQSNDQVAAQTEAAGLSVGAAIPSPLATEVALAQAPATDTPTAEPTATEIDPDVATATAEGEATVASIIATASTPGLEEEQTPVIDVTASPSASPDGLTPIGDATQTGEAGPTEDAPVLGTETSVASVPAVSTETTTQPATSTPLSTSTPLPSMTPTPSETPTLTVTPTRRGPAGTATPPRVVVVPPPAGMVTLVEPANEESLDGNGRKTFSWTALPGGLPEGYAYELVFWRPGEDGLVNGSSPVGSGPAPFVQVDMAAADNSLGTIVDPGNETCWGVRLWDTVQDRKVVMVSAGCRRFTYTGTSGSPPPSDDNGGNNTAPGAGGR